MASSDSSVVTTTAGASSVATATIEDTSSAAATSSAFAITTQSVPTTDISDAPCTTSAAKTACGFLFCVNSGQAFDCVSPPTPDVLATQQPKDGNYDNVVQTNPKAMLYRCNRVSVPGYNCVPTQAFPYIEEVPSGQASLSKFLGSLLR
jgi:hypothetical protein